MTLREHLEAIFADPDVRGRAAGHAVAAIRLLDETDVTDDDGLAGNIIPSGAPVTTYRLVPDPSAANS